MAFLQSSRKLAPSFPHKKIIKDVGREVLLS
jgi:hypothetical protein